MRAPRLRAPRWARLGSSVFFLKSSRLLTRRGAPLRGRRRSSQIIERVKNPKITFVQCNFHGKTSRNSDALFWSGTRAPAACGIPSWDFHVISVRKIKPIPANPDRPIVMRPVPRRGTGGARGGLHRIRIRNSIEFIFSNPGLECERTLSSSLFKFE